MCKPLGNTGVVSAEGIESARQRKFNNMQDHGWHRSTQKTFGNPTNGLQNGSRIYLSLRKIARLLFAYFQGYDPLENLTVSSAQNSQGSGAGIGHKVEHSWRRVACQFSGAVNCSLIGPGGSWRDAHEGGRGRRCNRC
jgi:hypothetical protein